MNIVDNYVICLFPLLDCVVGMPSVLITLIIKLMYFYLNHALIWESSIKIPAQNMSYVRVQFDFNCNYKYLSYLPSVKLIFEKLFSCFICKTMSVIL